MIEDNNNDELLFHRHCQATVLSAYGIGGQGATWNVINNLDLSNLENIVSNWKEYFTSNVQNITEDLAAILKLLDKVSLNETPSIYVKFTNNNNDTIDEKELGSETTFTGFGRDIKLTINNKTLQFNTMVQGSGIQDITEIEIPIPPDPATLVEGDMISIATSETEFGTQKTFSVKNEIPENYVGPIGISQDRKLVEYTPPSPPEPPEVKLTQEMFDQLWPIGSIYISINSEKPFQGISGVNSNWEQLALGRTLWNVPPDFESLGDNLDGILPNHHHSVNTPRHKTCENLYSTYDGGGYISAQTSETTSTELDDGVTSEVTVGNTLRPPSVAVTMWKRIS